MLNRRSQPFTLDSLDRRIGHDQLLAILGKTLRVFLNPEGFNAPE
jgi:hypothetical protein